MNELPVACTLGPGALETRQAGLLADLVRRAIDHHAVAEGRLSALFAS